MLECWNAGMFWHYDCMRTHDHDILKRTAEFAIRVIKLVDALPRRMAAIEIGRQLVRSAASVGAHCREARRARTTAEFRSKLAVAQQEAEEATYWLELIAGAELMPPPRLVLLQQEAGELLAMLIAAERTAARRKS